MWSEMLLFILSLASSSSFSSLSSQVPTYSCGFTVDQPLNNNATLNRWIGHTIKDFRFFHIINGCRVENSTILMLPDSCKLMTFCEARKCLRTNDIIFIGDSVTGQLIYSWTICYDRESCLGKWRTYTYKSGYHFEIIISENKQLNLRIMKTKVPLHDNGTISAYTSGLNELFDMGLLKQPATWIIYTGLHHMTCDFTLNGHSLCIDPNYHKHVKNMLTVIADNAKGYFYWRQTTSVWHDNIPLTIPSIVKHKFKNFTNHAVLNLNMVASSIVREFNGLFHIIDVYEASKNKSFFLRGDSRHFNGLGLKVLHQIIFNAWCIDQQQINTSSHL